MQRLRGRSFLLAATLLLVVATLHCPWEWQAAISQIVEVGHYRRTGQAVPIGIPARGCENESGCICRGATLAQAMDTSCLTTSTSRWVLLELPRGIVGAEVASAIGRSRPPDRGLAPPLSGRQLRALYASLLI
jgi:hypothetical protein